MATNQQPQTTPNNLGGENSPSESPTASSSNSQLNASVVKMVEELEQGGLIREVGNHAVWSLSSCKSGFGVGQLRDGLTSTYWQSDGPQPHVINIQFLQKTQLHCIMLYADYKQDESYTPKEVTIKVGNNFHDLSVVEKLVLDDPSGWIATLLTDKNDRPIKTFMVQISVEGNHQNGRDTHVRQVKVFSPCSHNSLSSLDTMPVFNSVEMSMYAVCR
ncbi:anaphase-promoting complex subunit 10-like [Convolutriloba macropyga]|uniref:anaphase-promoting complex subunit 10-like n=1 Tax=Convolutriloba macropyga TaxID=536237 RepID=UPI003F522EA4